MSTADSTTVCIAGVGYAVPAGIRANSEILKAFPLRTEDEMVRLTGIKERRFATDDESATDLAAVDANGTPTLDAESTAVYGKVSHRIMRNLTGSLVAQYQTSEFNEGLYDGKSEDLFLVGINVEYRFNQHFSAEAGYNYDMLDSDIKDTNTGSGPGGPIVNPNFGNETRSYDRNRIYIGLRATY